jgi:hypothetical protein
MLSSPNDKKLTKSSVHRAVSRGQFGVSPVKNGRPSKVPPELTHGLVCHAVNGWPEDPVELHPFDFHFTKERIIRTWNTVGFLPMTGNATKDPKVRYEMGEGGAPADATNRLDLLHADYRKSVEALTEMGFNGVIFDIEPPVVSKDIIPEGNEAKIQHIIDNRLINKAQGLYKTGLIIANAQVVLEAAKRIAV